MRRTDRAFDYVEWSDYVTQNERARMAYHRYKDNVDRRYVDLDWSAEDRQYRKWLADKHLDDPA